MTANIDAPVSPRTARQSGLSRRGFLKSVGVASIGIGIGLAACQPGTAPAKGEAAPGTVRDVTVWWGGWTPTQSMERSEDNPLPHNKIHLRIVQQPGNGPRPVLHDRLDLAQKQRVAIGRADRPIRCAVGDVPLP